MSLLRANRFCVGFAVSAAFLVLLFTRTNVSELERNLRDLDADWLMAAIGTYLASVWVRALRYRFILSSCISLSPWQLAPVLSVGYMANNLLPARGGDLVRAHWLGDRFGVSRMFSLGTVAIEHLIDGLTLLVLIATTALLVGVNGTLRNLVIVTAPVFSIALVLVAVILASQRGREFLSLRLVLLIPRRFRIRAQEMVTAFVSGLTALRHPRPATAVILLSIVAWAMEGLVYGLVGRSLRLHVVPYDYLLAAATANLALTAPSSQAGIGPFEFFAAQTLISRGAATSAAVAFAFVTHMVVIVPITLLGLALLWWGNLTHREPRRGLQQTEPAPLPETA